MIRPTVSIDVQCWSNHKFAVSTASHETKDGAKVILLGMHPVRHWILSCDKDGEIFLWDYNTNKMLMRKTLSEISLVTGRENTAVRNDLSVATKNDSFSSFSAGASYYANGANEESLRYTQQCRSRGYVPSAMSQLIAKQAAALCINREANLNPYGNFPHTGATTATKRSKELKHNFGDIRQISFADRLAISSSSRIDIDAGLDTFNSDSRIMIVCDGAIILYDFIFDSAITITADKSDPTKAIRCASFIFKNVCAIGYGDGQIRLYSFNDKEAVAASKSKLLKAFSGHQKEIVMLKVLPVPDSSCQGMPKAKSSIVRLLSVCLEGIGLIWDFPILSGEFDLRHLNSSSSPTAKLQESIGALSYGSTGSGSGSLMLLEAFMDCDSHTLVTVASDRVFRLWDLGSVNHQDSKGYSEGGGQHGGTNSYSSHRSSIAARDSSKRFFKFPSSPKKKTDNSGKIQRMRNSLPGVCSIPCVGNVSAGSSLPPNLAKFVSCAVLEHPRFPFGTYAIVSKSNSIGIVQTADPGSVHAESERSSVNSSVDKSDRLTMLREISLGVLMHSYLTRTSSSGLLPSHSAQLTLAALDGGAKIYYVCSHPTQPHLLAIGTSIGTMVLTLAPSQSGPYIGTHPLWGKVAFSYSDKFVRKAVLDVVFESTNLSNSQSGSQQNDMDSVDLREKEKEKEREKGKEGDRQGERDKEGKVTVESDRYSVNGTALVEVDVTDEYLVTGGDNGISHNAPFFRGSLTTDVSTKSSLGREDLQRKRSLSGMMLGFGNKKELHFNGSTGGTVGTVTSHSSTKRGSGSQLGLAESDGDFYPVVPIIPSASTLPQTPINIATCRPLFYPSICGTHCALFWSESSFYAVYHVKLNKNKIRRCPSADSTSSSRMGSGRIGAAKMSLLSITEDEDLDMGIANKSEGISDSMMEESFIEVDRGRCISFAWIGNGKTYAVLTPGYRGESTVQKKSIFSKTEKEMGQYTPPEMVFKVLPSSGSGETASGAIDMLVDVSALSNTPTSTPSSSVYRALPQELHSGPILCVTSPREKADNLTGGQKAISKIEADAIAQQQSEMKKEMMGKEKDKGILSKKNKSSTASVESIAAASAVSWEESPGGGGEYFRATQTSRFYALTSTQSPPSESGNSLAPSLSLQAVGPTFTAVRSVTWEPSSGLCAVLVGLTVTILRLEITPHATPGPPLNHSDAHNIRTFNLSVYASVDLHAYVNPLSSLSFSSMISFSWRSGQLFAITSTELLLVCTGYPYLKSSTPPSDSQTDTDIRRKEKKDVKQKERSSDSLLKDTHACPIIDVLVIASSTPDSIHMKCRGHTNIASSQGVDSLGTGTGGGLGARRGGRQGVLSLKDTSGWLDIVGGRKGHILLSSRDGAITALSLTANPLVAIGSLLSFGPAAVNLAFPWAIPTLTTPSGVTDTACRMFYERGLMVDVLTQSLEKKEGRDKDGKRVSADDIKWSHSLLLETYARNVLPPKVEDIMFENGLL